MHLPTDVCHDTNCTEDSLLQHTNTYTRTHATGFTGMVKKVDHGLFALSWSEEARFTEYNIRSLENEFLWTNTNWTEAFYFFSKVLSHLLMPLQWK